ncbi:efflux RND transporter periplasmic adaptor subunit [Neisseria sp. Ec49-e6-T10]|uniref:efflux RND transporter periplasmic adaptor subunit n=1 Tax=Neisseria sp. Ec49-e6-T10 TaxID=3140744 RepID=UPI003EB79F9C
MSQDNKNDDQVNLSGEGETQNQIKQEVKDEASSEKAQPNKSTIHHQRSQTEQLKRALKYRLMVRRNRITYSILLVVLLIAIVISIWWFIIGQFEQETEDAYVDGNVVLVTAQVSGSVIGIDADNTDIVKAGQPLIHLNPIDAQLALSKAQSNLAQTVRSVRNQFASKDQSLANVQMKEAELAKTKSDYQRRSELASSGAISTEEVQRAKQAYEAAHAALQVAQKQLAGGQAMVDNTSVSTHPNVLNAAAALREAYIAAQRTTLPAPVSGMVTKRNVQVGQRINPASSLMSIVPLDHLWVNANFKESQLKNIRIGQKAELTADIYGRSVKYTGQVMGLDAGTGSAFALLPAQNATGNWIKVVQRLPVRIKLDADQVAKHPLRIGLSMHVKVFTKDKGQGSINNHTIKPQSYNTYVFKNELVQADKLIEQIIEENIGHAKK